MWIFEAEMELEKCFRVNLPIQDLDRLDYLLSVTEDYDEFCNPFYEEFQVSERECSTEY